MHESFEKWLRTYCFRTPSKKDYSLMKDSYCSGYEQAKKDSVLKFLKELENCSEILPSKVECVLTGSDIDRLCEAISDGEKC